MIPIYFIMESSVRQRYYDRPDAEDIDEVFPRVFQSGYAAARNHLLIKQLGITHILVTTPYAKPKWPEEFTYLVLDEIEDNMHQNIL